MYAVKKCVCLLIYSIKVCSRDITSLLLLLHNHLSVQLSVFSPPTTHLNAFCTI